MPRIPERLDGMSKARSHAIAGLALFVLIFAAYSNTFDCAFQFDDNHQIVENEAVRDIGNVPRFFVDASLFSRDTTVRRYRPLTSSSFALNYAVSGYRTWSWHLFNILLHFVNAVLVYLISARLFREDAGHGFRAFAVAVLFALHPVQTGTVTYISGRALLLSSLFSLAALYMFIGYRRGGPKWYLASGPALFALALLSKEVSVSLIGFMAAYDAVCRPADNGVKQARYAPAYIPFLAVLGLFVAVKEHTQGYVAFQDAAYGVVPYLLTELGVFLHYCRVMLFPINQNADLYWAATGGLDVHRVAGACVLLLVIAAAARYRRVMPEVSFFIGLALAALAPEHTLVPVADAAVEYRLYIACAGFAGVVVYMVSRLSPGGVSGKTAAVLAVLALMFLALTYDRNLVWADEYTFWSDVAGKSPRSRTAHYHLGRYYMAHDMPEKAIGEIGQVLRLNPWPGEVYAEYNNLGKCLFAVGRTDESLSIFRHAASLMPDRAEAYFNMGNAYMQLGLYKDAEEQLVRATKLDPGNARVHLVLGTVYKSEGRDADALRELEKSVSLDPSDMEAARLMEVLAGEADTRVP